MRFRKRSVKTMLGVTKTKRRINKMTGKSKVTRIVNLPTNTTRKVKRRMSYYSFPMKLFRWVQRKSK